MLNEQVQRWSFTRVTTGERLLDRFGRVYSGLFLGLAVLGTLLESQLMASVALFCCVADRKIPVYSFHLGQNASPAIQEGLQEQGISASTLGEVSGARDNVSVFPRGWEY